VQCSSILLLSMSHISKTHLLTCHQREVRGGGGSYPLAGVREEQEAQVLMTARGAALCRVLSAPAVAALAAPHTHACPLLLAADQRAQYRS
jgi:hypothetical protein